VRSAGAVLLIVMLLALSGLVFVSNAAVPSAALTSPAQLEPVSNVSQPAATATTQPLNSASQPPVQAGGVVDARTAVKVVGPAVVTVVNTLASTGGPSNSGAEAIGSGVIIDDQGHIVTNNHVVEGQSSLEVLFSDGRKAPAQIVGTDPFADLAVIKVDVPVPAVAQLGDSDLLEQGQPVIAIGSALGDLTNTVTEGVISAMHRDLLSQTNEPSLTDLIQTDAAINHGNSGGPLADLSGKVVGINVAVLRTADTSGDVAEGLGFSIPVNTVKEVSAQLISSGSVSRPFIGISFQEISAQIASMYNLSRDYGVLVTQVTAGSPADNAGIKVNSIITKFDGTELSGNNSLLALLMKHKVGDKVTLSVVDAGSDTEQM